MPDVFRVAIVSDIHYAGPGERQRPNYLFQGITSPLGRAVLNAFRRYVWLRDPFAHNHLLDRFIADAADADLVVANGDYSCDTGFVGLSDSAALESAAECLKHLRQAFPDRLEITPGDHELGKSSLGGGLGGPRLASWHALQSELHVPPFWRRDLGRYVLVGVTSSLVAFPVFEPEVLPAEREGWRRARDEHLRHLRHGFESIQAHQRILLFCHDPTALPFLAEEPVVRARLPQVERTVIGHLHTNIVLFKARLLAGMPVIRFLGNTPRRLSTALRQARRWRPFRVVLCPALAGTQLLKNGGYCSAELDLAGNAPVVFRHHKIPWK